MGPLRPGTYRLSISAPGFPWLRLQERELLADETWDLGMIHLERGGGLQVRFHYSGDGPRPQASVGVYDADGHASSGSAVTDSHHEILLPGSYRLSVTGPEVAAQWVPFEVRLGQETRFDVVIERGLRRDFTFVPPPASPPIERVFATIEGEAGIVYQQWLGRWGRDEFSAYCSFAPGTYTVTARTEQGHEGHAEFTVAGGRGGDEVIQIVLR